MSTQSSLGPKTIGVCSFTLDKMISRNCELQEQNKEAITDLRIERQRIEILEAENTVLKNDNTKLKNETTKEETLIQLIDGNLQSSKRVLQCVCAVAGAILGGGLVLVFPPVGAAIALGGTGSAVVGVSTAGAALVAGATGGCIVAPVIHEKTNNALIQQVQNFKEKEEVSKKAE